MPRHAEEAIVLRTRPIGDADLVVGFLTERSGKIEGVAKAARRSRRRFGGSLEPLSRGRMQWTEVEGRDLARVESFDLAVSFAKRQADLPWFYLFAYLAEVTDTFARDHEPDARFYRLLRAASDASGSGASPVRVRRWFEIWTLRLQGLLPEMDACAGCGASLAGSSSVAFDAGETRCERCAPQGRGRSESVRLPAGDLRWIRKALASRVEAVPEPERSAALGRFIRRLFTEFTGRPFRTARFLDAGPDEP